MHDLPYPQPIFPRQFVTLALVLIAISGCSGGGGGEGGAASVTAVSDSYFINNSGDPLTISAPGVLQNDSGSGLTAQLVSGPPTLTLNPNGSFSYTGGTATSFTYQAVNGTSSATATATISVNQLPVANNACVSTPLNTPVSGALSATDPEGQALTYAPGTQGGKGTVNIDSAGNYAYTPNNPNFRGMDQFTYQVTDPQGNLAIGTVTVLIDSTTPGRVRIMPLGDSITAGFPGGGTPQSFWVGYRQKLYNDLSAFNPTRFGIDYVGSLNTGDATPLADRDHEGHSGWCDDNNPTCTVSGGNNVAASVTGFLNGNPADIILLHIGTNHFDPNNTGVNSILTNISTWAQANYPVTVFVARIIPVIDGTLDVNTFNSSVANIATDRPGVKVFLVNQQSALALSGQPNNANPTLMGDNLHPNQAGYDKMADTWKADMLSLGVLPSCP